MKPLLRFRPGPLSVPAAIVLTMGASLAFAQLPARSPTSPPAAFSARPGARPVAPAAPVTAVPGGGSAVLPRGAPAPAGLAPVSPFPAGLPSPMPFPAGMPAPPDAGTPIPAGAATVGIGAAVVVPTAPLAGGYAGGLTGDTPSVSPQATVVVTGPLTALQIAQFFQQADSNRDGLLSRAEALRLPLVTMTFEDMDRNRDGSVSRSEYSDSLQ